MTEDRNDKELDEWLLAPTLVVGTWPARDAELREIPRLEEGIDPKPPRVPGKYKFYNQNVTFPFF